MLRFHLRSCFPLFFPLFSPVEIFAFLEGAVCLFRIHFWSDFHGLGNILASKTLQEAFQDASKKTSKFDAYFYGFGAVLTTPGAPKIDEKQLRWYPTQLLFWLQKRFCCEVGLEDAILDDCGFQNVNCAFQNVNFGRDFVLFFTCFWVLH